MLLVFVFVTASCSEDESPNNLQNTSKTSNNELTGNKFFDAAATKIMKHNSQMNRTQANCVVKNMTDSGEIGVGEINQMRLASDEISKNSSRLNESYNQAMESCK